MATKEQNAPSEEMDPYQVRSTALGAFERRPRQSVSHAVALAGPKSPLLPACAVAVICDRTWSARSNAYSSVRSNALPVFECRPVTCQSINRTLGPFCRELFFWTCF
jgi:hypothetical protein